jgi:uncharacterized protein (TIGR03086 family)
MIEDDVPAVMGGIALLERAINYTLGSLLLVTPTFMTRRTPCRRWDLRALLAHMNDSLRALSEAVDTGRVHLDIDGDGWDAAVDPVASLRARACHMLGEWSRSGGRETISIAGYPLSAGIVTGTGAIEVAVHGWDVAVACGRPRPIPPSLAEELLELAHLVVTAADRPGRFAAPVELSAQASPGDRLVAFLGRDPGAASR